MSQSQKTNLYDCLCAALRKPLSEGGHLALTAALHDLTAADIAGVVDLLTNDEAVVIFDWLDDTRAQLLLKHVKPEQAAYVLLHAPPGRISKMPDNSLSELT
jgi:Mg/Co/Ni transporter MgtE